MNYLEDLKDFSAKRTDKGPPEPSEWKNPDEAAEHGR